MTATERGAIAGIAAGFAVWLYALFLPSFGESFVMSATMIREGKLHQLDAKIGHDRLHDLP